MSKRFGRNQKRAMRKQIQELDLQIKRKNHEIGSIKMDLHQANKIVDMTAKVLGHAFISLPVKTTEVEEILSRFEYAGQSPFLNWPGRYGEGPARNAVFHSLCYLETYQGDIHADDIRNFVHMRYRSESGAVAYGISNEALNRLPDEQLAELFRNDIAHQMACKLVDHRNKQQTGRIFK